jgi:hypothetical protein
MREEKDAFSLCMFSYYCGVTSYLDTWRRQRKFFHFAQLQSQAHNPHHIAALTRNIHRTVDELLAAYSTTTTTTIKSTPSSSPSSSQNPSASAACPTTQLGRDPDPKSHWHRSWSRTSVARPPSSHTATLSHPPLKNM